MPLIAALKVKRWLQFRCIIDRVLPFIFRLPWLHQWIFSQLHGVFPLCCKLFQLNHWHYNNSWEVLLHLLLIHNLDSMIRHVWQHQIMKYRHLNASEEHHEASAKSRLCTSQMRGKNGDYQLSEVYFFKTQSYQAMFYQPVSYKNTNAHC